MDDAGFYSILANPRMPLSFASLIRASGLQLSCQVESMQESSSEDIERTVTWLGAYGCESPKPIQVVSTNLSLGPEVRRGKPDGAHRPLKLVRRVYDPVTEKMKVTGISHKLASSAEYPDAFGEQVAATYQMCLNVAPVVAA
jgi:hypothetical protein